jgi:hypothetical protein
MDMKSLKVSFDHFLKTFMPGDADNFAREYEDNLHAGERERLRLEKLKEQNVLREKDILYKKIIRDVKRDLLKKAREAGKRETVYSTKQGILGQYSSTKNSRNLFYFSDDEVVAAPLARFAYNNDIPAFKLFLEFTQKLMQDLGDAFIVKLECGHAAGFFSAAPEQFKLSIRRKES